jgi:hypothetical protein
MVDVETNPLLPKHQSRNQANEFSCLLLTQQRQKLHDSNAKLSFAPLSQATDPARPAASQRLGMPFRGLTRQTYWSSTQCHLVSTNQSAGVSLRLTTMTEKPDANAFRPMDQQTDYIESRLRWGNAFRLMYDLVNCF